MQSSEVLPAGIGEERKRSFRAGDRARLAQIRRAGEYELAYREQEPLVSVVMPTYERAELILERALPSVLAQDYERWELLIIGDCIAPGQAGLLRGIRDRRVFFHNLKARGKYPAQGLSRWLVAGSKPYNFGLRVARGRWITHLDDDDEYTSTHISLLLDLARRRRVEWVHGKVLLRPRDDDGEIAIDCEVPTFGRLAQPSSLYHAGLKTFRYNPRCWQYGYPGDWDLWERFLEARVSHAHLPEVVGYYYSISPDMRRRLRALNRTP
jgi:hypothetical protein